MLSQPVSRETFTSPFHVKQTQHFDSLPTESAPSYTRPQRPRYKAKPNSALTQKPSVADYRSSRLARPPSRNFLSNPRPAKAQPWHYPTGGSLPSKKLISAGSIQRATPNTPDGELRPGNPESPLRIRDPQFSADLWATESLETTTPHSASQRLPAPVRFGSD